MEVSGQEIHTFLLPRKLPIKLVNRAAGMVTIFFWKILKFLTCHIHSGIFLCLAEGQGSRMSLIGKITCHFSIQDITQQPLPSMLFLLGFYGKVAGEFGTDVKQNK